VTISLPTGQHVPKTASIVITRLDILAILSTQPRHVASLIRSNGMICRHKNRENLSHDPFEIILLCKSVDTTTLDVQNMLWGFFSLSASQLRPGSDVTQEKFHVVKFNNLSTTCWCQPREIGEFDEH